MEKPIKEQIIEELRKGDRFAGELKDALQIARYPELWTAIASLEAEGKIEHYFKDESPNAAVVYRLVRRESFKTLSPILPWGRRE
ncbi:MAG: hypothetical protein HWQ38_18775 [Nostoc sp. NMS7]|uniref:hypothetical protein n=1 Tax=Nostoc sp. NMS7 TaxID=2815391 RepID=UPI0025F5FC64|nr:hypothetical protein [Nostoc sp. NMS7]MBN3948380.1 hypothetical protein [Nostoc sp. NMS7]